MRDATAATAEAHARVVAAAPELSRIGTVAELLPDLPQSTLFHAGPPFADPSDLPAPVANATLLAARHEGWAATGQELAASLAKGAIRLAPAQDHGLVVPLALVVGPTMAALEVRDPTRALARVSPLNDGPPPHAARFGTGAKDGLDTLRALSGGIAADLANHISSPLPLLPLMAEALRSGDELHSKLSAAQALFRSSLAPDVAPETANYLDRAGQFVLNVVMAAVAVMLGAGAGVPGSRLVVRAGGNGRDFGWSVGDAPSEWIVRPAARPVGGRLPGREDAVPLPAVGDSAVIDAFGLGAASLRFAPDIAEALAGKVDPAFATEAAHHAFVGPHPALPEGVRVGLDLSRPRPCLGIMLGMVEESGREGLIGRGIAPWPDD